jgi:hypothetical protein
MQDGVPARPAKRTPTGSSQSERALARQAQRAICSVWYSFKTVAARARLAASLCWVREKRTMRGENLVPCLVLIVFLAFPRIALVLLFLFSNYLQRAYHGLLLPLLGFLFLPLTTLAYAWMMNTRQPIAGINLVILIVAVVVDLGGLSRGEYHRRRRWED